jgi:hypothetical protein
VVLPPSIEADRKPNTGRRAATRCLYPVDPQHVDPSQGDRPEGGVTDEMKSEVLETSRLRECGDSRYDRGRRIPAS